MFVANKIIKVANKIIAEGQSCFIIAEAGVNHNGSMATAKKLIDVAIEAGADAVKFQAFKTENVILRNIPKAPYQKRTTSARESQFEMLKKLEITLEQSLDLKRYCRKKGIIFLTTVFDEPTLDELDTLDLPAYKIASTDITNLPFLKKVAKKQKPIFLSTGMAYLAEVEMALREILPLNRDVILLQCSANYPINDEEVNLRVLETYKNRFDMIIGFSDHSRGVGASPYAVAMGVKVIEKHFTLDKNLRGPDHKASLCPAELKQLVAEIRRIERYLGSPIKKPTISEKETRKSLQKHFVASRQINKNEVFNEENLTEKRTGGPGISPIYYKDIFGKRASRGYEKDSIIATNELDEKDRLP